MSGATPAAAHTGAPHPRWTPGERLAGRDPVATPAEGAPVVGVLALQGDVLEHLRALRRVGADAREVRTRGQLDAVDALVLPGGESTTIGRLLEVFDLLDPVRDRVRAGMPVLGTCAGMILLATSLDQDRPQPLIGVLDVQVRRNAFGRQRESFDVELTVPELGEPPVDVSFIRAPVVTEVRAEDVEVLAEVELGPVLVRQGHVWAAAFHPELTGDDRLHAAFVGSLRRVTG
ncbi:MAG: pyridoxal 5'-phosphate synthase glutaminase subunit PdxT [Nitriliruptor sp.]